MCSSSGAFTRIVYLNHRLTEVPGLALFLDSTEQVVNYADDFVILSRGCAAGALNWTRSVMTRIGLTLNEAKTSIKQARKERFDFLGYTFGPHRLRKDGHQYLGASPSKKSVSKLRQKVGDLLVRQNVEPWTEVRDRLNRILRGWSNYFGYGTRLMAYRAVDHYVHERVRSFLRRRHKVSSRGIIVKLPEVDVISSQAAQTFVHLFLGCFFISCRALGHQKNLLALFWGKGF